MSNVFCGKCGAQASGGKFCGSCGAPLPSAEPTPAADETRIQEAPATPPAQPPYVPPAQPEPQQFQQPPAQQWGQPQYQQPQYQQPQYQPQYQQPQYQQPAQQWGAPQQPYAPPTPAINPFTGVPLTDFARDLGALVLLFGALALPWDIAEDASGRWWVVVATILSALSIGVPYLVKMNLVAGWGPAQSRVVKYALAAPYLISALAVIINELIHLNDLAEGGVGPAVGVGLAGALLAMQARTHDVEPTGQGDATWRTIVFALIGGGIAIYTVTTLIDMVDSFSDVDEVAAFLGFNLISLTCYAIVPGLAFVAFLKGGREWGRVLAAVGFGIVVTQFFGSADETDPLFAATTEKFTSGFGVVLVAAGTALLVSHPVQRRLMSAPTIPSWVQTARNACVTLAAALVLPAVGGLMILIGLDAVEGKQIVLLVMPVVAAGIGFLANVQLSGNPDHARKIVVALAGGIILLAFVEAIVGRSGEDLFTYSAAETVGWFVMPGLILFALLYPEEIRKSFRPLIASPPQQPGFGQLPPQGYPQQPPQGYQPPQQPPAGYQPPPAGYQPPEQPPQV